MAAKTEFPADESRGIDKVGRTKDSEDDLLGLLEEIEIKRPADLIIGQVHKLVVARRVKPGQRLPSERLLAEKFGVSRAAVREALRKLEFYGIVRTLPQSGTIVENIGIRTLEGLISNILSMKETDYQEMVQVRDVLEVLAVRLVVECASNKQIATVRQALEDQKKKVANGESGLEEDLFFHLKLAEATNNGLLCSLLSLIGPDVMRISEKYETYEGHRRHEAIIEHSAIMEAIEKRDAETAMGRMRDHISIGKKQFEKHLGEEQNS